MSTRQPTRQSLTTMDENIQSMRFLEREHLVVLQRDLEWLLSLKRQIMPGGISKLLPGETRAMSGGPWMVAPSMRVAYLEVVQASLMRPDQLDRVVQKQIDRQLQAINAARARHHWMSGFIDSKEWTIPVGQMPRAASPLPDMGAADANSWHTPTAPSPPPTRRPRSPLPGRRTRDVPRPARSRSPRRGHEPSTSPGSPEYVPTSPSPVDGPPSSPKDDGPEE